MQDLPISEIGKSDIAMRVPERRLLIDDKCLPLVVHRYRDYRTSPDNAEFCFAYVLYLLLHTKREIYMSNDYKNGSDA